MYRALADHLSGQSNSHRRAPFAGMAFSIVMLAGCGGDPAASGPQDDQPQGEQDSSALRAVVAAVTESAPQLATDPANETPDERFAESRFNRSEDQFITADRPQFVAADEAEFLDDEEEVLGFVIDGQPRAYSIRALSYHHAINDQVGETPLLVTYCVICSSGVGLDPRWEGRRLEFGFHGIWQGTAVLYDRKTRSHWLHVTGECVEGDLQGAKLKRISGRHVLWREWRRDHPNTQVMAEDPKFADEYFPAQNARRGRYFFPSGFLSTIQSRDDRLELHALVYGVTHGGKQKAYPIDALANGDGWTQDTVGDQPIVVIADELTRSAAGFVRRLEGRTIDIEKGEDGQLRDGATKSRLNAAGYFIDGPLQGSRLPLVDGLQAEWYGWYAIYPTTDLYEAPDK
ncbi:MAG: DUF3179 domain-containing (seleno)protein [Pirellulaceae bacterium]|jgi:hypothetical protein|nr:DUF3179 domain-containing (seleno)protein [Pirellulaceae bacterium]